ncbi:MAG: hypothetical protein RIM23_16045 [Coleofasciculus sp. G3-WIS-01]
MPTLRYIKRTQTAYFSAIEPRIAVTIGQSVQSVRTPKNLLLV